MINIDERLEDHWKAVRGVGFTDEQILGVFLYGSQNYNCATEHSDIDTKAIIIPTLEEAVLNKRWYVKELHLPNGEHCEVMDIRHFVDNLKKQNINFVETLFTDYYLLNREYIALWGNFFLTNRESIAYYDMRRALDSMCGQAIHNLTQNPHDGKKVGNAYRIMVTLTRYLCHKPYRECIEMDEDIAKRIIDYKTNGIDDEYFVYCLKSIFIGYKQAPASQLVQIDKVYIDNLLDDVILTAIKQLEHLSVL